MAKKRIFSGIQPTGNPHIGNYLGSIKNWLELQNQYDCFFCIVDLHAITIPQNPKTLRKKILEVAEIYLASGIDPQKSTIFVQSHVSEHTELSWILSTLAKTSEMQLMTQFKDKSQKQKSPNLGLLSYPVLMAADILLYNTDLVPVGEDQTQHLELTRKLAKRFNERYGETFTLPEQFTPKTGSRIMGLNDPSQKMSKSAAPANRIELLDRPETILKKVARAVTDSESLIKYDKKNKAGISNLLEIDHLISNQPIKDIEKKYQGKGYGQYKKELGQRIADYLAPLREKMKSLDSKEITDILDQGAQKAKQRAQKKLTEIKEKIGFI